MPRVLTNKGQQLLKAFKRRVKEADRIDIVTAWVTDCAALEALDELAKANCGVRAIVGLSDRITVPSALKTLRDWGDVKVVDQKKGIFHPKVYIFHRNGRPTLGWTGSANFSDRGFSSNYELVLETTSLSASSTLTKWFDGLWDQPCCKLLTDELLKDYRHRFKEKPGREPGVPPDASRGPATGRHAVAKGKDSKQIVIVQHGVRPTPRRANKSGEPIKGQVTVAGTTYDYDSAAKCLEFVLTELQKRDSSFSRRCLQDERFKSKPSSVAQKEGELQKGVKITKISNGLWLAIGKLETQQKWDLMRAAAETADMTLDVANGGELWEAETSAWLEVGF